MQYGQLRDYFAGVGVKRLSAVDAEPDKSNQHEIGTTQAMREQFLGEYRRKFQVVYFWLAEDENGLMVENTATHYDTRENKPDRSPEWRLYYTSNPVTERMREGDTLFLAMDRKQILYFIVTPAASSSEQQMSWLFGLNPTGRSFASRKLEDDGTELGDAAHFILDEIGFEVLKTEPDTLDSIIEKFGTEFPRTVEFSNLARETLPDIKAEDDPDTALVDWVIHEKALFKQLERRVVSARIREGFHDGDTTDVDGFIRFSLSVHNRRKSRMGHSLENHLEAVFRSCDVAYVRGAVTENKQRPDFLFPDQETYRSAPDAGCSRLTMLGAKSTCKDRWRQVLAEAAKIPRKHLLTLEPGISEAQTTQMQQSNLQLVVPQSIQVSYTDAQQEWLWNLSKFIDHVKTR